MIKWVNCAKCVAIMAVMTDHTKDILYTNHHIKTGSFFAVALFVLLSGMTAYMTRQKSMQTSWGKGYIQKTSRIFAGYCIATVLYVIAEARFFDFAVFLDRFLHFNASGPLYFVLLYMQLMLLNKPLLVFLEKVKGKYEIFSELALLGVIIVFSSWTATKSNILNVYGGGGKLFGGSALILFYLGMLLEKHGIFRKISIKKSVSCFLIFGSLWFTEWIYLCKYGFKLEQIMGSPFGKGIHPPGILMMLSALLMLFTCFGLFTWWEQMHPAGKKIVEMVSWIGSCSMSIFLFHNLFLDYFLVKYIHLENRFLQSTIYFFVMIAGSIMIEKVMRTAVKPFRAKGQLQQR